MADFNDEKLTGSHFHGVDLTASEFRKVDFTGSLFRGADFTDVEFRGVMLERILMRGVELVDVEISGELQRVTINGVGVGPLIDAELNRRYPERSKMRPTDAAGFREAWDVLERVWSGTVARAKTLNPGQLHESVKDEWSFIQTLRHLVFATDSWIRRGILGDPAPWHPLGLPWGSAPSDAGLPCDWHAQPSLDEVLEMRRDRQSGVRDYLQSLTDDELEQMGPAVDAPGWPPPRSFPIRECLLVVLNEEWEHRMYAERDLDVLEAGSEKMSG